jgi:RNA polymerase sigma-70 factor (ECF subfamily)
MTINGLADQENAVVLQEPIAFEDLLLRTLPSLRQYALALTRNRPDADDLLQNAVSNALRARDSYMPGTNFKAWMSCILRNRFLSDIRRRRETVSVEDAPPELFARPAAQDGHMALAELKHAMARLQPDHRLALVMIAVQGMSYEEASAELGVPVGTVKCRVFRARKLLHAWLLSDDDTPRLPSKVMKPAGISTGIPGNRNGRVTVKNTAFLVC